MGDLIHNIEILPVGHRSQSTECYCKLLITIAKAAAAAYRGCTRDNVKKIKMVLVITLILLVCDKFSCQSKSLNGSNRLQMTCCDICWRNHQTVVSIATKLSMGYQPFQRQKVVNKICQSCTKFGQRQVIFLSRRYKCQYH